MIQQNFNSKKVFLIFVVSLEWMWRKAFLLHDGYRADDPIDDGPSLRSWCVGFECHKHQKIEIRANSLRNGSGWWLKSISGWVRRTPRRTLTSFLVTNWLDSLDWHFVRRCEQAGIQICIKKRFTHTKSCCSSGLVASETTLYHYELEGITTTIYSSTSALYREGNQQGRTQDKSNSAFKFDCNLSNPNLSVFPVIWVLQSSQSQEKYDSFEMPC